MITICYQYLDRETRRAIPNPRPDRDSAQNTLQSLNGKMHQQSVMALSLQGDVKWRYLHIISKSISNQGDKKKIVEKKIVIKWQ